MSFPEYKPADLIIEAEAMLARKYEDRPEPEFTVRLPVSRVLGINQFLDSVSKVPDLAVGGILVGERLQEMVRSFTKSTSGFNVNDSRSQIPVSLNQTNRDIIESISKDPSLMAIRREGKRKLITSIDLLLGGYDQQLRKAQSKKNKGRTR